MTLDQLRVELDRAMQKVTKWRALFAGWQLGTRPQTDPETQAVRDTRELLILLRIEVNALTAVLMDRGVMTEELWLSTLLNEAKAYDEALAKRFAPWESTDYGLSMDLSRLGGDLPEWMKGWKP